MDKFKNYINGKWVDAVSGKTFKNINPANHEDIIGEFAYSEKADVDNAVAAAKEAYKKWRLVPAPKRGDIIRKAGDIFARRKKEIAKIMTREMGKPTFETEGDIQEAIDTAYYAASETRRLFGYNAPSELENKMNLSFRVPIGVVGVITAWNFPIAVPSWKILPAIAAGNTVVYKPSKETPHSGVVFAEVMEEAGLPPGVFNVLTGVGSMGNMIVEHPDVKVIGFTGSTDIGCKIGEICGRLNKRVSLEMGGKNAQIIMDDANLELAIEGALWGAFGTTGQRCTATSRLIVHKDVYEQVVQLLKERAEKLRLGDGLKEGTDVGPVIHDKALEGIHNYVLKALEEGGRLICGGERATEGELAKGSFYKPTIIADVEPHHTIFKEEIFGPVLAVTKAESLDHAIELQNNCDYGLSSSIYTRNVNHAFKAIRDIEAGITYINAPTIGAEAHMPFGGIKGTGNGHREGGWTVFDIFTEWKTVYVDYSDRLQRAQIDNY
ncbi:MAG TPA: aldehyde dehydrogenase family protein [Candidatus Kapabacteria bacterium]|jgi:aldehyde dehydrogenase (NAD+)|nr:aldehyde dehydrogenase family protein [Candidatus Kapabacteria bacterium]HPU23702.1 aldehyde dehydrogenase family protein [Candidatus Kapabacteria bacterium]